MPRRSAHPVGVESWLGRADARTKLLLSLAVAAGVMLPLPQLTALLLSYMALAIAAGVVRPVLGTVRRSGVFLVVLFAADWFFIGFDFAVLIAVRLCLLITAFGVFFATTTADELCAALEQMRLPARFAFAFATAYRFVGLLEAEWRGILEAQRARGIALPSDAGAIWRAPRRHLAQAVALVVPAVVLATQRAWAITEAAATRGFPSPLGASQPGRRLSALDHVLLSATAGLMLSLFLWK